MSASRILTIKNKTTVIFMIIFINVCLIVPVWQASINYRVCTDIERMHTSTTYLREEKRTLIANASVSSNPEVRRAKAVISEEKSPVAVSAPSEVVKLSGNAGKIMN